MSDNGLLAMVQGMLSNSSVTELSLDINPQLNELGRRWAASGLQLAANGQVSLSNFLAETLTIGALGNTTINGYMNVVNTLQVAGLTTLVGNTSCNGFVNIASTLQVVGVTTLGNANIAGN